MRREKLINARKRKGLSQVQLAEELGFSREAVSKWECGLETPHPSNATHIAAYFGMDKKDLDLDHEQDAASSPTPTQVVTVARLNRQSRPRWDLLMNARRYALYQLVNSASALLFFPYGHLPEDDQKQLALAQIHSRYLDDKALDNLSGTTVMYWSMLESAPLDTLLDVASHHFEIILRFLKDTHAVHIYNRLCILASETAQLMARIFHFINEDDLSYDYYTFALKVALDVGHTDLWAVGVGRLALLQLYWKDPRDGLPLLQAAQHAKIQDPRLRAYLLAIEAEIYAETGNMNACQRLLAQSKSMELPTTLEDDIYWTGFDPSLRYGYEGACYVRLRKPDLALDPLQQSLELIDSALIAEQATRMIDIASVQAQLGHPKKACELLRGVLDTITKARSVIDLERVYKARAELTQWKNNPDVKGLDDQLYDTLRAFKKRTKDS